MHTHTQDTGTATDGSFTDESPSPERNPFVSDHQRLDALDDAEFAQDQRQGLRLEVARLTAEVHSLQEALRVADADRLRWRQRAVDLAFKLKDSRTEPLRRGAIARLARFFRPTRGTP
jgi:septal ring factor EnvC (AmiA/AmiB activator)